MSRGVTIDTALTSLPEKGITVYSLRALDFVVPGEWQNVNQLDDMIRSVTGEQEPAKRYVIAVKAREVFSDPGRGYQKALWLYQATDKADAALGTAAMASKIGERIDFLSFLNRFTPAADTTQAIDLALKVVVEMLSFSFVNGFPTSRESIAKFAAALKDTYRHEALMRMAALVCFDGLIPLGPDFVLKVGDLLAGTDERQAEENPLFGQVAQIVPAEGDGGRMGFIKETYMSVRGFMDELLAKRGLSVEKVTASLRKFIEFTDDKLDYLAAFLDLSTSYYTHTGTQSLARYAIREAAKQVAELQAAELAAQAAQAAARQSAAAAPPAQLPGVPATGAVAVPAFLAPAGGQAVVPDFLKELRPVAPTLPAGPTQPAEALYDYRATAPGFLSFSQGEVLLVSGTGTSSFSQAQSCQGQVGWVPTGYLRPLGSAQVGQGRPPLPTGPRVAVMRESCYTFTFQAIAGQRVTITGAEEGGHYWATNATGQSGWVSARSITFQ